MSKIWPDQEAFCNQRRPRVQCQTPQVGKCQGLIPLVSIFSGDYQGRVEVPSCLWDATLTPQTQSQQVMDHTSLSGTVCSLQKDAKARITHDIHLCLDIIHCKCVILHQFITGRCTCSDVSSGCRTLWAFSAWPVNTSNHPSNTDASNPSSSLMWPPFSTARWAQCSALSRAPYCW